MIDNGIMDHSLKSDISSLSQSLMYSPYESLPLSQTELEPITFANIMFIYTFWAVGTTLCIVEFATEIWPIVKEKIRSLMNVIFGSLGFVRNYLKAHKKKVQTMH